MILNVPDDIVLQAEANATDLLTAMAVQLYADSRIDHLQACRLSGLAPVDLTRELVSRGLVVQLSGDSYRQAG
ncbi:MAG: hypothetical protein GXY38_13075 [Planctomycetes bacterium]|jgi:predicted HTH domain antitoxin|nr:hypothetical protein [Planctomycetota bacterium]